jgi:octaprenyl-diphosphate synthase
MSLLQQIQDSIAPELEEFEHRFCEELQSDTPLLQEILKYLLLGKGKRFRPMLVFLSAKLFGEATPDTYTAASMVEILHTATLVHDDVVDESDQRRGHSSVNALWNSKIAVLAGDFLLSHGLHIALKRHSYTSLEVVAKTLREMSEGELLQIHKSRTLDVSESEYYRIIFQKTAALISVCTQAGAQSVGCTEQQAEHMKQFGEHLGMAFQIRDDLFDLTSDNHSGKPPGNDLKEHKLTLPLIHALSQAPSRECSLIRERIRTHSGQPEFAGELADFVLKQGGIVYARKRMEEYRDRALEILALYPQGQARLSLEWLVRFATDRDL